MKKTWLPPGIFAQTPKGDIREFPINSCLLDFAYAIHSDLGNYCIGAKINEVYTEDLKTPLKNGCVVKIFKGKTLQVKPEWLSFVGTTHAKQIIRIHLRKIKKDDAIKLGRALLKQALVKKQTMINQINKSTFKTALSQLQCHNQNDLYWQIGTGRLPIAIVINHLIKLQPNTFKEIKKIVFPWFKSSPKKQKSILKNAAIDELNLMIHYAQCCLPIFGDEVRGHIKQDHGLTIHRKNCLNLRGLKKQTKSSGMGLIELDWDQMDQAKIKAEYKAGLRH